MKIPIRNVYYLLCYAGGERILEPRAEWTGAICGPENLASLLAFVLIRRMKPLVRRGLDRNYSEAEEETIAPRGRIAFEASIARCSVRRQALICRRDELDVNVLQNQVLRTTLHLLANDQSIDVSRRIEAARLERLLHLVDVIPLNQDVFRRVQLHRNNAGYRFLLNVCELIWLGLLPDPEAFQHRTTFDEIRSDDRVMERIFEDFIGNFYRLEIPSLDVSTQERLKWDAGPGSDLRYLPVMRADAVLRSRRTGDTLVADAKYYRETLVSFHDRERVRSGHLYQITAYLRSAELKSIDTEGLLIYPQSGTPVSATFFLSGKRVRVRTVDLSMGWPEIHTSLCDLVAHID
ncbi:MAG: hypothetical protein ABI972_15415 [Acidobacteriota bacterium]